MAKDYRAVLGVPGTASHRELRKACRKLVMQYHPDRNLGEEKWARGRLKEISEACAVLGDPQKRRQYDQFGTTGNVGDIAGHEEDTEGRREELETRIPAGVKTGNGESRLWPSHHRSSPCSTLVS